MTHIGRRILGVAVVLIMVGFLGALVLFPTATRDSARSEV
jgi:hypothetical protein